MATKAKAPAVTGLAISQSGTKIVCSFKVNKHASKVETQYRLGTAAWKTVSNNEKSCSVTINTNNYAPNAGKPTVPYIEFKVRQYIDMKYVKSSLSGKKWSTWTPKRYTFAAPNGLKSYAELDEDDPNKTSYHFTGTNSPASAFFKNIEYQSILVFENDITDGRELTWNASQPGWRTGTVTGSVEDGVRSGSITITEDSEALANGSQTRWVQFRSRGIANNSAWTYAKHVYAQPYKPTNLVVKKAELQQSYYQCSLNWKTPTSASHPVDYIVLQYAVAVPTASQEPPSGASWTEITRLAPKDGTDGYSFIVPETLEEDECLFLRVASYHDTEQNYNASAAAIAVTGNLADPEDLSVVTDDTTHKATVTATNKSTVAGSFLAIKYIPASNPQNAFYVGIIPNGQSSVQVQCPNWDAETAFAFTVQAFAGTYTAKQRADGAYTYELDTWMESAGVLKDGGAVPVAPENVTAVPTDTSGTIRVAWDWSWESANKAILSWADHEDAWESTDAPSTYEVEGIHAPAWNISGLETGKTWYIRVALAEVNGENETQSPWSDIIAVDLASAPSVPTLVLDKSVIAADDSFTASWGYVSTDGTTQAYAVLCLATITPNGIVYGDEIAHTQTAQHITLSAEELGWSAGNTYHLCVKVTSASGKVSDSWSDPVALTIAEALTATIDSTSLTEETIAYNEETLTAGTTVNFETDADRIVTHAVAHIDQKTGGSTSAHLFHNDERSYRTDNTPYLFRAVGGSQSKGYDTIIGGSVVENQLMGTATGSSSGVTASFASGEWSLSGQATSTYSACFPTVYCIKDHVYFNDVVVTANPNNLSLEVLPFNINWGNSTNRIRKASATVNSSYGIDHATVGTDFSGVKLRINFVDLTLMFGTAIADYAYQLEQATAGSGIAWLKSYGFLTEDYIPYNEGEIKSVSGLVSHDTVGFNQFDKSTATAGKRFAGSGKIIADRATGSISDFIKVVPNTTYYAKDVSGSGIGDTFVYYDKNKTWVGTFSLSANAKTSGVFTVPSDAYYMRFQYETADEDTVCINLSWSGYRNGEYEPYVKHSYPLDSSLTLMGKPLLVDGKIQYDGDKYHSEGTKDERFNIGDLGDLVWSYSTASAVFYADISDLKVNVQGQMSKVVCEKYASAISTYVSQITDKTIMQSFETNRIYIKDSAYTDATAFKQAMDGVMFVYEKATPTTSQAEPFTNPQICDPNGTEEYVTSGIPVGHETEYFDGEIYVADWKEEAGAIGQGSFDFATGELIKTHNANGTALAEPVTYHLDKFDITTLEGDNALWANTGNITLAKIADAVLVALCLTEMPLTATITGAGQGGTTILAIERAQDYQMTRPDGDTSDGFESQTVALFSQMGEEEISIDNADLIGHLDDGAWYKIVATVQDGFGQSASAEEVFLVRWSHQALMPEAEAEPIEEYNAMAITPIPPNGTQEGDSFDIYRLSADKPELVVEGGEWGTTYVDPYPAIRELGGHRVVFKTKNGDYITEDNNLAWINLAKDEGDYIDRDCSIIDFEGAELIVRLNMSVTDEYEKQFTETQYKGGSVVGDWNKGISRKGAVKAVALAEDLDTVLTLRELARYEGVCHVRTPNGTSYAADVQVDLDQSFEDVERAVSFNLTITRVDGQELDGMTLDEWYAMHPEESE